MCGHCLSIMRAMTSGARQYASYLVRIWQRRDRAGGQNEAWLADVEHIQTGVRRRFYRVDDVWEFLRRHAKEGAVEHEEADDVEAETELDG